MHRSSPCYVANVGGPQPGLRRPPLYASLLG
jgi:hypothetical protein